MIPPNGMTRVQRFLSSLFFGAGILLVFTGLSTSMGFTLPGMLASVGLIAALLYAGAMWFGAPTLLALPPGAEAVIVFDRELRVAAGPGIGTSVLTRFPVAVRSEVERRCRAALGGAVVHFVCEIGRRRLAVEIAPVASPSGPAQYAILTARAGLPIPLVGATAAPTTA